MHAHRSYTRPARCTYPVAAMAIAAALILYLGTYAEAQLAKQGTYTGRFGWSAVGKTVELESEHALFVGEFNGVAFNDAGSGFLHGTAFICPGLNDLRKGLSLASQGYCIVTDADATQHISRGRDAPRPRPTGSRVSTAGRAGPASTPG
jgi:hypothetical protein